MLDAPWQLVHVGELGLDPSAGPQDVLRVHGALDELLRERAPRVRARVSNELTKEGQVAFPFEPRSLSDFSSAGLVAQFDALRHLAELAAALRICQEEPGFQALMALARQNRALLPEQLERALSLGARACLRLARRELPPTVWERTIGLFQGAEAARLAASPPDALAQTIRELERRVRLQLEVCEADARLRALAGSWRLLEAWSTGRGDPRWPLITAIDERCVHDDPALLTRCLAATPMSTPVALVVVQSECASGTMALVRHAVASRACLAAVTPATGMLDAFWTDGPGSSNPASSALRAWLARSLAGLRGRPLFTPTALLRE